VAGQTSTGTREERLIVTAYDEPSMSETTLFTKIVDGEIPSYTVYEDETTYAFLDANPLAPGHTLVIPKEPYERLSEMPRDVAADVFGVVAEVTEAVESGVDAPASTVAVNNGEAAGQEVPHVHWHIVPQFADDTARPIHALFDGAELSDEEMEAVAASIRDSR
jgi:histidine triad (HIT) family protein